MQLVPFDVNTKDFTRPGVRSLVAAITNAPPEAIVLLHDAAPPGTPDDERDRAQTIEAVDEALNQMAKRATGP
jgi:hypothetical protein